MKISTAAILLMTLCCIDAVPTPLAQHGVDHAPTNLINSMIGVGAATPSDAAAASPSEDVEIGEVIPNNFVVVYKAGVTDAQAAAHQASIDAAAAQRNGSMSGVNAAYSMPGIKGFAVEADKATMSSIMRSPLVASSEEDTVVKMTGTGITNTQTNSQWGLSRISHRYNFNTYSSYVYDTSAGSGTFVYVLDTGILTSHQDFGGRAIWGANFVVGSRNTDDNGHGTHCAGTIGSATFGVAKNTTLIAVKVLDSTGSGSYSSVIAGLQWVAVDVLTKGRLGRAVVSMSLAGGYSAALNAAVDALVATGVAVYVAAGNVGADASQFSPASAQNAFTVAAIDANSNRPSWSNYGSAVAMFGPGQDIVSTWNSCSTCVNTLSGTSMATPHVAGMAVYMMAREGVRKPSDLFRRLNYLSIYGQVNNPAGSTNRIVFNGNAY